MDVFLNGLKEEVGSEVKLHEPRNLSMMMKKTLMIDQKNQAVLKTGGSSGSKSYGAFRSPSFTRTVTVDTGQRTTTKGNIATTSTVGSNSGSNTERSYNKGRSGGLKRLSETEMQEKIRKGECFKCDEKYGPNHVCKNKQFRVMLLEEGEEIEEEGEEQQQGIEDDIPKFK